MKDRIVTLGRAEAIAAIDKEKTVMYRHGVWNEYNPINAEAAKKSIEASGYGADIYVIDGKIYVSIPCDSDMW